MKWADLSEDAKSILEWTEHVWSGQPQLLTIERGKTFIQPKYVSIFVTDDLFEQILRYLPYSRETVHIIEGDTIKVTLKNGVKLH